MKLRFTHVSLCRSPETNIIESIRMKRGGVVAVCATVANANEIRRVAVEGQVTVFHRISSVDRRLTFPPLET